MYIEKALLGKAIRVDYMAEKIPYRSIVSSIKPKYFLISVFCTNCRHEIVFVLICRTVRTISSVQLVQKM